MNGYSKNPEQPEIKINKRNPKRLMIFAIVLLLVATLGGIGYSIYTWQQNASLMSALSTKESDNKKLLENIAALKKDLGTNNEQKAIIPDKELARETAQNFVDAQVLDMKYIAGTPEIKGSFASSGVTPSSRPSHIGSGILLKKINGHWVVIHHGQNGPDQDTITRFAVPEEFRS